MRRRQINKVTGELKNTIDYSSLTVTEATADIAFIHRAPLDDPRNSIPPDAAIDIKVCFYPQQLITPISASSPADDKLRSATETIRLLRQGSVLEVPSGNSGQMVQWKGEQEREQLSSISDQTSLNQNGPSVSLQAIELTRLQLNLSL